MGVVKVAGSNMSQYKFSVSLGYLSVNLSSRTETCFFDNLAYLLVIDK